tara:strand:+ start:2958 stop:3209 length:252 start_codon:yes stop_codon:yes gene_type:complete
MFKVKEISKYTSDLRSLETDLEDLILNDYEINQILLLCADVFLAENTAQHDRNHAEHIIKNHQPPDFDPIQVAKIGFMQSKPV